MFQSGAGVMRRACLVLFSLSTSMVAGDSHARHKVKLVVPRRKKHLEAASAADLMATAGAVELVNRAREARPDNGPRCLIVPSRIDRRTSAGREIEGALRQFGEKVGPAIGQRTVFVDAFGAGQWVGEYSPRSKATAEVTALSRAIKRML